MRLILIALFITIPYFSFSQNDGFTILIDSIELPTDKIPDSLALPQRVDRFMIKKDRAENAQRPYVVQVGEEEHTFLPNGRYQQIIFTHDIKGMVIGILDDRRVKRGKPFKLKPLKIPKTNRK
jgi:hypothetical protein